MIIILKAILLCLGIFGFLVGRVLYKDYKNTKKSEEYEDLTIADKLKFQSILYISITAIGIFCLLILFFIISPITIVPIF
jgi:dolichol kinase